MLSSALFARCRSAMFCRCRPAKYSTIAWGSLDSHPAADSQLSNRSLKERESLCSPVSDPIPS
eukprot:CAMPEP_0180158656 /NCGR_PEP_ID=MMETSP0986-20121125/27033_1 /TAXON_ID=697907 /ORGANISM="non described non described, Strain CCMP2293" /LENGTH=62 /DNA_ID=CAMNT_0022108541 /DNA_START=115 /DNA_END=299 /DNA_ORIENTATION=-